MGFSPIWYHVRCHKRKIYLKVGENKEEKGAGERRRRGGHNGWLLWRFERGAGAAFRAAGCVLRSALVLGLLPQGLGLALPRGGTPGLVRSRNRFWGERSCRSAPYWDSRIGMRQRFPLRAAAWYEARCASQLGKVQGASDRQNLSWLYQWRSPWCRGTLAAFYRLSPGCLDRHHGYPRNGYFTVGKLVVRTSGEPCREGWAWEWPLDGTP